VDEDQDYSTVVKDPPFLSRQECQLNRISNQKDALDARVDF